MYSAILNIMLFTNSRQWELKTNQHRELDVFVCSTTTTVLYVINIVIESMYASCIYATQIRIVILLYLALQEQTFEGKKINMHCIDILSEMCKWVRTLTEEEKFEIEKSNCDAWYNEIAGLEWSGQIIENCIAT